MHLGTKNILSAIYDSAPSDARPSMRVFVEDLSMAVAKALSVLADSLSPAHD